MIVCPCKISKRWLESMVALRPVRTTQSQCTAICTLRQKMASLTSVRKRTVSKGSEHSRHGFWITSERETTMRIGTKAQGTDHMAKLCVARHGKASKRSCNAAEKAAETKVRQAGKKAAKDYLERGAERLPFFYPFPAWHTTCKVQ